MAIFKSFGQAPSTDRQIRFKSSPNFRDNQFWNISPTEMMSDKSSMFKMSLKFLNKPKNTAPSKALPSVKTNLKNLQSNEPEIIWFGHSSYFIRLAGKNILVDPVFGGHASPFRVGVSSFAGTDAYTVDDLPNIDLLILTHDHYDHLDHRTLLKLKPKISKILTPLGLSSHLEYWGFSKEIITESDWWQEHQPLEGISITATPARHFSGRSFKRNLTLWSSFVVKNGDIQLYIGSDSGYDKHFRQIGERFGNFDLAILETGQYNESWPMIHMTPEETVQAAIDLHAKILLPVHWGKFSLAFHPWYEPIERVLARASEFNLCVTTPLIGEPIILNSSYPTSKWWIPYK